MLRLEIFELINEGIDIGRDKILIAKDIIEHLEDEEYSIKDKGIAEYDISELIKGETKKEKMLSAAKILYNLDLNGLELDQNGAFDDDPEWEKYCDIFLNY